MKVVHFTQEDKDKFIVKYPLGHPLDYAIIDSDGDICEFFETVEDANKGLQKWELMEE